MKRKNKYIPKSFESKSGKVLSAVIYASMIQSPAWEHLSNNARVLYLYMKLQYYGAKNIPDHSEDCFYFNTALIQKTYKLYTNMRQFRKDRDQLVDYGFIKILESGKNTRTKAIYQFSDEWQNWSG